MSSKLSPIESMAVDAQNENGSQRSMGAILNDLPRTTQHIRMFWLICAALFVDFFDLTMGGAIAASLLNDGWTTLALRSEEHTSELQSLMRISYAVFCFKKTNRRQ